VLGGKYELFWDPADLNHNITIGCKITAIEPLKLLCFTWKNPKQFENFVNGNPLGHVSIIVFENLLMKTNRSAFDEHRIGGK
jgi:uncharacterized protein YndB with AHSA1/START domain